MSPGPTPADSLGPPLDWRWIPATLPSDQCDTCGAPPVGYWVKQEERTGRRLLVSACTAHAKFRPRNPEEPS